jgi:hypothetical protein
MSPYFELLLITKPLSQLWQIFFDVLAIDVDRMRMGSFNNFLSRPNDVKKLLFIHLKKQAVGDTIINGN